MVYVPEGGVEEKGERERENGGRRRGETTKDRKEDFTAMGTEKGPGACRRSQEKWESRRSETEDKQKNGRST